MADDRRGAAAVARYAAGAVLARLADEGARVGLVLLAVDRRGSAAFGGALVAALMVPHVLAAPVVGFAVDRVRHRRAFHAGMLVAYGCGLAAVAQSAGRAPDAAVLAVAAAAGCCAPLVTGALTGLLGELVRPRALSRAFGMDAMCYNLAGVAGPSLTAAVAARYGPVAAVCALAASAAAGSLAVASLPLPPRRTTTRGAALAREAAGDRRATAARGAAASRSPAASCGAVPRLAGSSRRTHGGCGRGASGSAAAARGRQASRGGSAPCSAAGSRPAATPRAAAVCAARAALAGCAAVLEDRRLRAVTLASVLGQVGSGALPLVAVLLADSGRADFGGAGLMAAYAAGGLCGGLLYAHRPCRPRRCEQVVMGALLCTAVTLAGVPAVPAAWAPLLFAVAGCWTGPGFGALLTARQRHAPPHLRGQVFTVGAGLKTAAAALGSATAAALSARPPSHLLWAAASCQLAAALVGFALLTGHANSLGRPVRRSAAGSRSYADPRWRHAASQAEPAHAAGVARPRAGRPRAREKTRGPRT